MTMCSWSQINLKKKMETAVDMWVFCLFQVLFEFLDFFFLISESFACFSSILAFDRSLKSAYFWMSESLLTHTGLWYTRNWPKLCTY